MKSHIMHSLLSGFLSRATQINRRLGVTMGVVLATATASGHPAVGNTPKHSHIEFTSVSTAYRLIDEDGLAVNVTWTTIPPPIPNPIPPNWNGSVKTRTHKYSVTIRSENGAKIDKTYSLLTLGTQKITSELKIDSWTSKSGGAVMVAVGTAPLVVMDPAIQSHSQVLPTLTDGATSVDAANVRFLHFANDSEFTLYISEVRRDHVGETTWQLNKSRASRTGHDNNPPKNPPD